MWCLSLVFLVTAVTTTQSTPSTTAKLTKSRVVSNFSSFIVSVQNFVVTDPSLPDNPIVYATQGFLDLTGYTLQQVLGRNCRFLQGPETDPHAVEKIRKSIEVGEDMSVCLLNYRVDGSTFWNQFFIAALRDGEGNITNYVGVQCRVSEQYARNVCEKQDLEEQLGDDKALKGGCAWVCIYVLEGNLIWEFRCSTHCRMLAG